MGKRDERILSCVFMAIVRYHFLNGESKLIFNYWLALIGKKYFYSSFFHYICIRKEIKTI